MTEALPLICKIRPKGQFFPSPAQVQILHFPRVMSLSLAFSLTALIFYVPANMLPFMTIELYGNRQSSTIWQGIVTLIDSGSLTVGVVVFLASILIPLLKLLILFYLAASAGYGNHTDFKLKLLSFVEIIGRWSMLDIFLLAVLVSMLKLGRWTTVQPEPGSALFTLVVIFTMLASATFDQRTLQEDHNAKQA